MLKPPLRGVCERGRRGFSAGRGRPVAPSEAARAHSRDHPGGGGPLPPATPARPCKPSPNPPLEQRAERRVQLTRPARDVHGNAAVQHGLLKVRRPPVPRQHEAKDAPRQQGRVVALVTRARRGRGGRKPAGCRGRAWGWGCGAAWGFGSAPLLRAPQGGCKAGCNGHEGWVPPRGVPRWRTPASERPAPSPQLPRAPWGAQGRPRSPSPARQPRPAPPHLNLSRPPDAGAVLGRPPPVPRERVHLLPQAVAERLWPALPHRAPEEQQDVPVAVLRAEGHSGVVRGRRPAGFGGFRGCVRTCNGWGGAGCGVVVERTQRPQTSRHSAAQHSAAQPPRKPNAL
jgi:hypothetical protein